MTFGIVPGRFADKIVVVTGAGSGIGRATAVLFASHGAKVAVNDVRKDAADETVRLIERQGGTGYAIAGDVSDERTVRANVQQIVQDVGPIDVLVNNAGRATSKPAEDYDQWSLAIGINLNGPFYWAQQVARASMIPRRSGAIVNVASLSGLSAHPLDVGYMAAKHGVVGLTKGLAIDWACYNIRVNCICPGLTDTPIVQQSTAAIVSNMTQRIPLGRAADAQEQAQAIVFLSSDDASYITGVALPVDGGIMALKSLFPPRPTPHTRGEPS